MQVYPVNSAVSFGRKDDKNKTLLVPATLVGGAGAAVYANSTKIKLDNDSYLNSIDIIDKKMDKSLELQERFDYLKKQIKTFTDKLASLGANDNSTEITVEDMLKNYVGNPNNKGLEGLDADIAWLKGQALDLDGDKLLAKKAEIKEREFIKSLAQNATDGKVKTSEIRNYVEAQLRENTVIKGEVIDFSKMIKSFNIKRVGVFTLFGLTLGAIICNLIKINKK